MHPGRFRLLRQGPDRTGPVLYWMHREHRASDNWGLLFAQEQAIARGVPLAVAHCLDPAYPGAALRHFAFLLAGLRQTEAALRHCGIPLLSCLGDPAREIPALAHKVKAAVLVLDFDPLRHKQAWARAVVEAVEAEVWEADSRNIVPCRAASSKKEWAARTLRPKIHRLLPEYLEQPPRLAPHPHPWPAKVPAVHWDRTLTALAPDPSVPPVDWIAPGETAAARALDDFIETRLPLYADQKNDPNKQAVSLLSPYLHFGQLSSLRAALAVSRAGAPDRARDVFLEELIVRRELADNFCLHEPAYDRFQGFPDWARKTLDKHRGDRREYVYGRDGLEAGQTHDPLWNAAQRQMTATGHLHGWLRMYWAKKILEWSASPEAAQDTAVALNDRWLLDGRDPNGYAGIAWSLGGVHDRPWGERPVFGTVRFMSFKGACGKFDVPGFIRTWGGED
ncbi:MAG TPA: deoxyribodipyrimidine photolyase [Desulfovibrio sp.]|nr:deoxyribodipyrimidine photolyase [Desulfovibrio sp.]